MGSFVSVYKGPKLCTQLTIIRLRKLLDMVSGTQKWPIQSVEIPSSWTSDSGRLALLGDAAHAMLPNMALGENDREVADFILD